MENESETPENTNEVIEKVDLNRFPLHKFSRWTDDKGRLLILIGFHHGTDPAKPYSGSFERVGVDILNVQEEKAEYMLIGRFIHFIINKKIMPWKAQAEPVLPIINELA